MICAEKFWYVWKNSDVPGKNLYVRKNFCDFPLPLTNIFGKRNIN